MQRRPDRRSAMQFFTIAAGGDGSLSLKGSLGQFGTTNKQKVKGAADPSATAVHTITAACYLSATTVLTGNADGAICTWKKMKSGLWALKDTTRAHQKGGPPLLFRCRILVLGGAGWKRWKHGAMQGERGASDGMHEGRGWGERIGRQRGSRGGGRDRPGIGVGEKTGGKQMGGGGGRRISGCCQQGP